MAPRTLNKLTDVGIRKAKTPRLYGDGGGLYLRIDAQGLKRWVLVFQWRGKRAEMGLGPLADVSLAEARDERDRARKMVRAGKNPVIERRAARSAAAATSQTFGEWAEEIAPSIGPKAEKARKAWVSMLQAKVGALADLPPASIQTEHILKALKPYWQSRPESGKRMRQRIERTLDAAKAKGLIPEPWANPARLKGHLENLLPKRSTAVKHHAALPYDQMAEFMARLRARDHMAALALEWTILTVSRTKETLGARWSEIDLAEKLWIVPAERMKGASDRRREHRVPLTEAAMAVLGRAKAPPGVKQPPHVFPGFRGGSMSTASMERVMQDMGMQGVATVHGFRSSFRDWAGETTNFQRETIEAALAHLVGDETERAYRRGDALLKRRKLMEAWAGFLGRKAGDNVRSLSRGRSA